VFDNVNFVYKMSQNDNRKCKSVAYDISKSPSALCVSDNSKRLDYGSAKVMGQMYKDAVCLPNSVKCAKFDFVAIFQADGFDNEDGVLGLAMHPDKDNGHLNYVWMLKNAGMIDRAMVSFSVAGPGMNEKSYADFGGFDERQVVNGRDGIAKMATMGYRLNAEAKNNWALQGESVFYDDDEIV
jgi:hypothetical protein